MEQERQEIAAILKSWKEAVEASMAARKIVLHTFMCSVARPLMKTKGRNKPQTEKTNITLKLDRDLLREIKILAAKQDTSISALVTMEIEKLVKGQGGYEQAMKRSMARMKKGLNLGWQKPSSRDELYDRKILR